MLTLDQLRTEIAFDRQLLVPVDGVTLSIQPGETFALVGESGSGKSITALTIARLLPDNARIASGAVNLGALKLADLSEQSMQTLRGRRIAMIFQEPATSLNPVLTIGAHIIESIETHTALRGTAARECAIDWLRRVGIPEPEQRIDRYPFELSGGQKQRVMIAAALAAEPDLLIADEPTTALDVTVQKQVLDLLADLQRERGMAMLLITHDLGIVAHYADRLALMYAGQLVEVANTAAFFARPAHPYAQRLLAALPGRAKQGERLDAIAGQAPALQQLPAGCRFAPRCPDAQARCERTMPDLLTVNGEHQARCWAYDANSGVTLQSHPTIAAPSPRSSVTRALQPLIKVSDLNVNFPIRTGLLRRVTGSFAAVKQVSFEIHAGETLALVGESGSGKTTVGKAIVQLLRRQAIISGSASLHGIDLMRTHGEALRQARRSIQIIFQDPYGSLNPRMRIGDILQEGLITLRPELNATARANRVSKLLDQVGLPSTALTRYPHQFSGGQRQRIAIARALAVDPQLIICDEPTSALDVSVQAQILNLLKSLQQELGVAYLFITHNIGVVEYLADRIAVMQSGEIVEQGPAEALLDDAKHDYTRALLAAVL